MTRTKSKDTTLQGNVNMEDMPYEGQNVYYIDHREGHGVLPATVISIDHDGSEVNLRVKDHNGHFNALSSIHDEAMSPGTWHYPK